MWIIGCGEILLSVFYEYSTSLNPQTRVKQSIFSGKPVETDAFVHPCNINIFLRLIFYTLQEKLKSAYSYNIYRAIGQGVKPTSHRQGWLNIYNRQNDNFAERYA